MKSPRYQKMLIVGILLFAMLVSTVPLASAQQEASVSTAMDLVIMIDDSNSMYGSQNNDNANDPEHYRNEAASIMLNMAEMNASRAAVISFGDKPVDIVPKGMNYDAGLLAIGQDHIQTRKLLTSRISTWKFRHNNTNVAAGLQRASELFEKTGTKEGNQRVLLIISDNQPFFKEHETDGSAAAIRYGTKLAMEVIQTDPLFDPARPDSIKVYVVELLNKSLQADINDPYHQMARRTDGAVFTANNAEQLPIKFAEMLASQIGSSLTQVTATSYEKGNGLYGIPIRIPNQSVKEANLLMSMEGVKPNSVKLYRPLQDGQTQPEQAYIDDQTIFYTTSKSFVQYKITTMKDNGTWELTYELDPKKGTDKAPATSVTLLFNYQLTLEKELRVINGKNPISAVEKNDTLQLSVWFNDHAGEPSTDKLLYNPVQIDEQGRRQGIEVRAFVLPEGQEPASGVIPTGAHTLTPSQDGHGGFELKAKPTELGITKAGAYQLFVHAEGDGLLRDLDAPIRFSVINNPPQFLKDVSVTLTIHDPNSEDMEALARHTLTLQNSDLCRDADTGFDKVSLSAASLSDDLVWVEDENDADDMLTLVGGKAGSATVELTASDGEPDGVVKQPITVRVLDVAQELSQRYVPEIEVTTPSYAQGQYSIGSEVAVVLRLRDMQPQGPVTIEGYTLKPVLTLTEEDGSIRELTLTQQKNQNEWTATFEAGTRTQQVSLQAAIQAGLAQNNFALHMAEPLNIKLLNVAPQAAQEQIDSYRYTYWTEPMFPTQQADTTYAIDLNASFADDDPLTKRSYQAVLLRKEGTAPQNPQEAAEVLAAAQPALQTAVDAEGQLTLTPNIPGEYRLLAVMYNQEGQSAFFSRDVKVESYRAVFWQTALKIVLALVAAGIAGLVIVWLLKPVYGKLDWELQRNGRMFKLQNLPSGKKYRQISSYYGAAGSSQDPNIMNTLRNITFQPANGQAIILKVKIRPPMGIELDINGRPINKPEKIRMGREAVLTIRSRNGVAADSYGWKLIERKVQVTAGRNPRP